MTSPRTGDAERAQRKPRLLLRFDGAFLLRFAPRTFDGSSLFHNRYLSPVDHRAKDRLRIRAYLRYMDDMLLFGDDAAELGAWGRALEEGCHRQRLRLHPWQVQRTSSGVGWLGFRILPTAVRVKRTSVNRAKARLLRLASEADTPEQRGRLLASVRSTFAHWRHADTWRLREQTLRELGLFDEEDDDPS